jgi:type IV secretory pathway VirB10-like protein
MSDPQAPPTPAASLRLRPGRPSVTRLSRKVLIGLGGAGALGVTGLCVWALQSSHKAAPPQPVSTDSHTVAEGLGALPHDYGAVPKTPPPLGPPLPGDLGRPILKAEGGAPAVAASAAPSPPDPVQQQRIQEREAAATSRLFFGDASAAGRLANGAGTAAGAGGAASEADGVPASGLASAAKPSTDATAVQSQQDQKLAFLKAGDASPAVSAERLTRPASPYVLQAGAVIAAALITGVRSDLPGEVTAQVTENVYDSPTGRVLLIPQGARLVGQYDSQIAFAQSRVQLVWTRLILPDGAAVTLDRQIGADARGYSGLEDGVNNHWGTLVKAALLSTVLSVGAEAGTSDSENNLAQAIRQGASQSFNQAGQQIVERNLNVPPTLTIRPGLPVRVLVSRDLILAPYRG